MDVIESDQLQTVQAFRHWYYRAKFHLIRTHLREITSLNQSSQVADFGCGLGAFLTYLEKKNIFHADQLTGIDIAFSQPGTAIGGSAKIYPTWPADTQFDLILMMDVLEHTADDAATLAEAHHHLSPNGYIFITVPAFQWLFSAHDRFLGHYRRYTTRSLARLIATCPDLEIVRLHYYYASVFPLAVPIRLMRRSDRGTSASDLKYLPKFVNYILRAVTYLEAPFAKWNGLFGLSAVALCRKVATKS